MVVVMLKRNQGIFYCCYGCNRKEDKTYCVYVVNDNKVISVAVMIKINLEEYLWRIYLVRNVAINFHRNLSVINYIICICLPPDKLCSGRWAKQTLGSILDVCESGFGQWRKPKYIPYFVINKFLIWTSH